MEQSEVCQVYELTLSIKVQYITFKIVIFKTLTLPFLEETNPPTDFPLWLSNTRQFYLSRESWHIWDLSKTRCLVQAFTRATGKNTEREIEGWMRSILHTVNIFTITSVVSRITVKLQSQSIWFKIYQQYARTPWSKGKAVQHLFNSESERSRSHSVQCGQNCYTCRLTLS